jgi:hypothetical protein
MPPQIQINIAVRACVACMGAGVAVTQRFFFSWAKNGAAKRMRRVCVHEQLNKKQSCALLQTLKKGRLTFRVQGQPASSRAALLSTPSARATPAFLSNALRCDRRMQGIEIAQ